MRDSATPRGGDEQSEDSRYHIKDDYRAVFLTEAGELLTVMEVVHSRGDAVQQQPAFAESLSQLDFPISMVSPNGVDQYCFVSVDADDDNIEYEKLTRRRDQLVCILSSIAAVRVLPPDEVVDGLVVLGDAWAFQPV